MWLEPAGSTRFAVSHDGVERLETAHRFELLTGGVIADERESPPLLAKTLELAEKRGTSKASEPFAGSLDHPLLHLSFDARRIEL